MENKFNHVKTHIEIAEAIPREEFNDYQRCEYHLLISIAKSLYNMQLNDKKRKVK